MSGHHCCEAASTGSNPAIIAYCRIRPHPPGFARRCFDLVQWAAPGAILALLPKCPACIAAYIAVGTGIGISLSAAAFLRMLLIVVCLAALSYLGVRRLRLIVSASTARSGGTLVGIKHQSGR